LTIQFLNEFIVPNVTFCSQYTINDGNEFNTNLNKLCQQNCPVSCDDDVYDLYYHTIDERVNTLHPYDGLYAYYKFQLAQHYYIFIIYSPQLTFKGLVISMASILSLWHGIN